MATGYMTPTTQANVIAEAWGPYILAALYARNHMREAFSFMPTTAGADTTHIPTFGQFSAEEVTVGTELTGKNMTPGTKDLALDQYWAVPFTIPRITERFTANYALQQIYINQAAAAIANKIETNLMGYYASMSQEEKPTTNITFEDIVSAGQALDDANVPRDGRVLIVTPYQFGKMKQIDLFAQYYQYGANTAATGNLPMVDGVKVIVSTNIPTNSSFRFNMLVHPMYAYYGILWDAQVDIGPFMPLKQAHDVVVSSVWGSVETFDTAAVKLPTAN